MKEIIAQDFSEENIRTKMIKSCKPIRKRGRWSNDTEEFISHYPEVAKEIGLLESTGEIDKAYALAKENHYQDMMDDLALKHDITGHEFLDFPNLQSKDFMESMRVALKSRLQPGAIAEYLGFTGFKDKIVFDVGTRDGRFVPIFRDLGAKDVYGIDPNQEDLQEATKNGLLDKEHAIPCKLEDLPDELKGKFNMAAVFHFNIKPSEQADFFASLHEYLPDNGQVVMTVAEDSVLNKFHKYYDPYFYGRVAKLWGDDENYLHKNLVILTKKSSYK